jgi:hypothetical protein
MSNNFDVKELVIPLYATDWDGDAKYMHLFKAPDDGQGGGVTLLEAWIVNQATTTSGTAHAWELQNWGTAGTAIKTSGGTIAAAIGGTADVFTSGVPKEFTLSNAFIDAGEWVVLRKDEDNSSDPTRGILTITYVMGK